MYISAAASLLCSQLLLCVHRALPREAGLASSLGRSSSDMDEHIGLTARVAEHILTRDNTAQLLHEADTATGEDDARQQAAERGTPRNSGWNSGP